MRRKKNDGNNMAFKHEEDKTVLPDECQWAEAEPLGDGQNRKVFPNFGMGCLKFEVDGDDDRPEYEDCSAEDGH